MIITKDYDKYIIEYLNANEERFYTTNKSKKNKEIINFIPMGFDIETTTQYTKDENGNVIEHYSNMYIWMFQFTKDFTFIGRTFSELVKLINSIEKYVCHAKLKTIVFIHNMQFEFQFVAKELLKHGKHTQVFARKKRRPMKWILDEKIIFLDSYLLTHLSLEKLALNYCKTKKMVGDLDYSLVRNSFTTLTKKELGYCVNDVAILEEYAEFYEKEYLSKNFLPMTQTMIANRVMTDTINELQCKDDVFYLMKKCYPKSKKEYDYIMLFYSGAYTHANIHSLFSTHVDCLAYDVTSEYPYEMMNGYYPMSKFRELKDLSKVDSFLKTKCCLCDVTLTNIKSKKGITILSKNKLIDIDNAIFDNGRLYEAKSVHCFITEIDIETLKLHYDFSIKFNHVSYADKGYLPNYFRLTIAKLYVEKTMLKGIKGKEREYMCSKEKLNGQYGAMCTKLTFEEISFSDSWESSEKDINFDKIWMSKDKLPQWAIWVTSHSRNLILSAVAKINIEDYHYSDTDSIKCNNKQYIIDLFKQINSQIIESNKKWINELELDRIYPNIDFSKMGTFDREKDIKRFKTLGSKRYLCEFYDGEIEQTVAGLPKKTFINYCEKQNLEPFDFFSENGINISDSESSKLTTFYVDEEKTFNVLDYQGNNEEVTTQSYVSLIPITFNMKISDDLTRLYNELISLNDKYN